MKRECNYCDATTNKPLYDFHEIGWEAVSYNCGKAICSCPKYTDDLWEDHKAKKFY